MRRIQPPAPVYLGPAAHTSTGDNKPIYRIVIHSTVSPCAPGWARKIAAYFRSKSSGGSAHYVVDPLEEVQVVYDGVIAWHAPPNPHSIGIEMCDTPGPIPGDKPGSAAWKALKRSWRWRLPAQRQMLRRTAKLTAQLALAYDVPLRWCNAPAAAGGARHHQPRQCQPGLATVDALGSRLLASAPLHEDGAGRGREAAGGHRDEAAPFFTVTS